MKCENCGKTDYPSWLCGCGKKHETYEQSIIREHKMMKDMFEYIIEYGEQVGWSRVNQICHMVLAGNDPRKILRMEKT